MWIVIFIAGTITLLMIALLIAYFNLRKRYMTCLEGWEKANQSVEEILSLNDQIIKLNKRLYLELYGNKESDNNECK